MGVILEETGREGRWGDLRRGGGGEEGGTHELVHNDLLCV